MEYLSLFEKLQEKSVRYLICGGLAVNIYGIPRMTADIDLLLAFDAENIRRFEEVAHEMAFQPQIPLRLDHLLDETNRQELIRDKNLIAFSYYNTRSHYLNLDVLIDTPLTFEEMWAQREVRHAEHTEVLIVSLEHLFLLKKYANRKHDIQDILLLSRLNNIPLDPDFLPSDPL